MPVKKGTTAKTIEKTLTADRVTKGAIRFMEDTAEFPMSIYLRHAQAKELGLDIEEGQEITITIAAA